MIEFIGLSKKYGRTIALSDISIDLQLNRSYALLGPNGSGKTTFIKLILGMVIPTKGQILVNKTDIKKNHMYRENIGYMPQIGQYPANMTVKQVFDMMRDLRNGHRHVLDEELMESYRIRDIWNKKTSALSGGTRQKVSACLAFLFNPGILILDEPTAGLDPLSSEILKNKIIKETQQNKLIIITSHILSDLDEIITDVIYLNEGQLLIEEPLSLLRKNSGENALSKIIAQFMRSRQLNTENVQGN